MDTSDDLLFYDCGLNQLSDNTIKDIENMIFAIRPPPTNDNNLKKRAGAKQANPFGRPESVGSAPNRKEAPVFRALAARCNYLAQDRCDIAYSTEELCRELAVPNRRAYAK